MSLSYSHDHLGSVWYHSEPSEALIPQTSNWSGTIFGHFLQQTALTAVPAAMRGETSKEAVLPRLCEIAGGSKLVLWPLL